jgi:Carboxypeptidase regulatory-like domain
MRYRCGPPIISVLLVLLVAGRGHALTGVVLADESGRPLPGAEIRVFKDGSECMKFGPPLATITTGADGRFDIADYPLAVSRPAIGCGVAVVARAPGRAEVCRTVGPVRWSQDIELRLIRAATVRGIVVSEDGKPLAGARVFAVPRNGCCLPLLEYPETARVVTRDGGWEALKVLTDHAGRYRLDVLAPGRSYHVFAEAPGLARSEESVIQAPAAGKVHEHAIRVRRFASLRVVVKDVAGRPLDVALALLEPSLDRPDARQLGQGATLFETVVPGEYVLLVTSDSHVDREIPVQLPEGETTEIEVCLEAGVMVKGMTVDDRGVPMAGIEVLLGDGPSRPLVPWSGKTVSDEEGRFRFEGLLPGRYTFAFSPPDRGEVLHAQVSAPAEDARLVLPRSAGLVCRVIVPRDHLPLRMKVLERRTAQRPLRLTRLEWPWTHVRVTRLTPGGIDIVFFVRGFALVRRRLELAPGEVADLGKIRFGPGVALVGSVVDPDGRPLRGVALDAGPAWSGKTSVAVTDDRGRFRLERVAPGPVEVRARLRGFLPGKADLVAAAKAESAVVTLRRGGVVHGRVTTSDGRPAVGVEMALIDPAGTDDTDRRWFADTDATGAFEIRVPPGRYRLVFDDDEPVPIRDVDLKEGDVVDMEIVLRG